MEIEETITIIGYAWLDETDKSVNWATKEDMEGIDPKKRPAGCTPVVIEICPTNEWVTKKQKDYEFLGDLAGQVNQFSSELQQLQKTIRAKETK
jgi:hypothetical protein